MHPTASSILITWRRNGQYARGLVADLSPASWTAQPVADVRINHPAWILCHLNVYAPICSAMLRDEPFADPIGHRFGQRSEVSENPEEYPPGATVLREFEALHADAEHALSGASPEVFGASNPLDRWRGVNPTIGDMLVTLMVKHESGHLGQLSAWRRAMGMARVPM